MSMSMIDVDVDDMMLMSITIGRRVGRLQVRDDKHFIDGDITLL